ncbi:MAG: hypothetical protein IPP40_04695 [bacterium]|nr:hypothetical protein [bacterium]
MTTRLGSRCTWEYRVAWVGPFASLRDDNVIYVFDLAWGGRIAIRPYKGCVLFGRHGASRYIFESGAHAVRHYKIHDVVRGGRHACRPYSLKAGRACVAEGGGLA